MAEYKEILDTLDYWIGITECNCNSPLPTGGCERCDLEGIKTFLVAMEKRDREMCTYMSIQPCGPEHPIGICTRCEFLDKFTSLKFPQMKKKEDDNAEV